MELSPRHKDIISAKICPYCNSKTRGASQEEVYGKRYSNRVMIVCKNFPSCDSYVGTHDDGTTLGRLANRELRQFKKAAHEAFDKLWKEKYINRDTAYEQLADYLGLPDRYTHIGMFGKETCAKVVLWATEKYQKEVAQ